VKKNGRKPLLVLIVYQLVLSRHFAEIKLIWLAF